MGHRASISQHYNTISQNYNTISQHYNNIAPQYNAIRRALGRGRWAAAARRNRVLPGTWVAILSLLETTKVFKLGVRT